MLGGAQTADEVLSEFGFRGVTGSNSHIPVILVYQAVDRVTCDKTFHVRSDPSIAVEMSLDCAPLAELTDECLFRCWDHL
jgi:hypothetical protein